LWKPSWLEACCVRRPLGVLHGKLKERNRPAPVVGMVASLSPDIRKLIEAIEAWPAALSNAGQSRERGPPTAQPEYEAAPPGPELKLCSALRAPPHHRTYSMASGVPQRENLLQTGKALSSDIGPGYYPITVHSTVVRDPARRQRHFASTVPARPKRLQGPVGVKEIPDPGSAYAHSSEVLPPLSEGISGASPFASLSHRFEPGGYLRALALQQQQPSTKRPTPYRFGAPHWDGPYAPAAEPPLVIPSDHAARLAAARASPGLTSVAAPPSPGLAPVRE